MRKSSRACYPRDLFNRRCPAESADCPRHELLTAEMLSGCETFSKQCDDTIMVQIQNVSKYSMHGTRTSMPPFVTGFIGVSFDCAVSSLRLRAQLAVVSIAFFPATTHAVFLCQAIRLAGMRLVFFCCPHAVHPSVAASSSTGSHLPSRLAARDGSDLQQICSRKR